MRIYRYHPQRVEEIKGPKKVNQLLKELDILPETVLVILKKEGRDEADELLPQDGHIEDNESVEIRPVISGGGE